jgi:hypothetical protein
VCATQLDALGRPAELSTLQQSPLAARREAARELAALKQARVQCEDATAAYHELLERLQEGTSAAEQVSFCCPYVDDLDLQAKLAMMKTLQHVPCSIGG